MSITSSLCEVITSAAKDLLTAADAIDALADYAPPEAAPVARKVAAQYRAQAVRYDGIVHTMREGA